MVQYAANLRRSFLYASTVIHLTLLLSHVHTSIIASFLNRGSVQFFTSIKQSCILYNFLVLIWLPKKSCTTSNQNSIQTGFQNTIAQTVTFQRLKNGMLIYIHHRMINLLELYIHFFVSVPIWLLVFRTYPQTLFFKLLVITIRLLYI